MRNGVGYWMMSKPCPPIEDTSAFAADWHPSRPRGAIPRTALIWLRIAPCSDCDPMGSAMRISAHPIDFEVAMRLM